MAAEAAGLFEREGELRALDEQLERAYTGSGRLIVVEGPAGIGKTSLLTAVTAEAEARGLRALRARGDELTMEASFATVRELLLPALEAPGDLLVGAAALAAPVFQGAQPAPGDADRIAAVLHGLYWLLANLADRGPLLLVVDDAHWLDVASGRFLQYLARRLESLPVLAVAAVRRGESLGREELRADLTEAAARVLAPQPLSEPGAARLVRREMGPRADAELCRCCHEATGGNPFYLSELVRSLRAQPGRPTPAAAEAVRRSGVGAVARGVLVRLARLGPDCERVAEVLAVLAPGTPLRHVAVLCGLERERAQVAADRLRAAELLADERALSFAHPIVREAVAAELMPSRRAALHLEAARLLAAEEGPRDRVAAHLLSAEPYGEQWVIGALRAAARDALARGAPEAAVAYLRRALAEPPTSEQRLELLVELGRAEALLPVEQEFTTLREALAIAEDPVVRAEIALELAWALTPLGRFCEVAHLLERTLDSGGALPAPLTVRLEALLLGAGGPCLRACARVRARARPHLARGERGELEDPVMYAALAQTWGIAGLPADRMARLAAHALRDGRLVGFPSAYVGAAVALMWADDFAGAARALEAGIAEAQRRGSAPLFMHLSAFRAQTALHAGELQLAESYVERALELGRELGAAHFGVMFLVPVLLERDGIAQAAELISSVALGEAELQSWQGVVVLAHRGRIHVARGELEAGVADLLGADRRMCAGGCQLSVLCDWAPTAAAALAQLSRHDDARTLAMRELTQAREFGASRRLGMALSTAGLLDHGEHGLELLSEAVDLLARSPARLEYARALVSLGVALRARGRRTQARVPLARGMELAEACAASTLVARARGELVAAGARPRRCALSGPRSLTPAELRVARLAATGRSNREIAQALFLTTKTVEWQLTHVYSKLEIPGRAGLTAALAGTPDAAVPV